MSELGKQKYLKKLTSDITVSKYADDFLSISKRTRLKMFGTLPKTIWKKGIPIPTGYIT